MRRRDFFAISTALLVARPLAARAQPAHVPRTALRILKSAKPGDLPFEAPAKSELVLLRAEVLGLVLPASLLARADEVIE